LTHVAGKAMTTDSLQTPDPSEPTFTRDDFRYSLPGELIAQSPLADRDASRLMVVAGDEPEHLCFRDLPGLLQPDDLLIVNDTRVVKARLLATKDSGGRAEILLERIEAGDIALCQVRVSKPLKVGRTLFLGDTRLTVLGREGPFYRLSFPGSVMAVLDAHGSVPLPPYIARPPGPEDEDRYQTVWNAAPGAVAAPTAGLHFTARLLDEIRARGVRIEKLTLHVGAGTFQPVRNADLAAHRMHSERFEIGASVVDAVAGSAARGGRIVAVGTTVVRALETAATGRYRVATGAGETRLFITPGYRFQVVDALVTNFHLPESTLLMLICAFGGYERVMRAYHAAVAAKYRFFSYGDAMFIEHRW
jgi:S-adenosylmethionine:tRNA ribosyltransferase-isomerase